MRQWIKWNNVDLATGTPSVSFPWNGGKGYIVVTGFAHDAGESIGLSFEIPDFLPEAPAVPNVDIQDSGTFPFESPAGILKLTVGSGVLLSWETLTLFSVD